MSGQCDVCGQVGCVESKHCSFADHLTEQDDRITELEAENARLAAVVERLPKTAETRYEDKDGWFLTEPRRQTTQPTRRVYVVDADTFDAEAAASASARDLQGGE